MLLMLKVTSINVFQLSSGSLLLTMVSATDSGLYTCLAENSQGSAEVTFQLDLTELGRFATGSKFIISIDQV